MYLYSKNESIDGLLANGKYKFRILNSLVILHQKILKGAETTRYKNNKEMKLSCLVLGYLEPSESLISEITGWVHS